MYLLLCMLLYESMREILINSYYFNLPIHLVALFCL